MNIYADVTDEGLQPFYTYTLEEIAAQYEYDGNCMPIGKVYVQYYEDEYYLEDPAEVEDDNQLLTENEVKAIFSYLDGNYPLGKTMPGGWAGKTYNRLLATNPHLAETLLQTPIQMVTIQAPSYWEAVIAVYPQICGHARETVELEQQMLMRYLDDYGLDYRDPDCNIFTDKEYCDWEVSNLKMGLARQKKTEFRYTGLRVPVPQLSPHEFSKIAEWQIRATEFVARHHARGVVPC